MLLMVAQRFEVDPQLAGSCWRAGEVRASWWRGLGELLARPWCYR